MSRILLVDDQPIVHLAVQRLIDGEADLELHYCERAGEAVARAVELAPDVILQDLVMPGVDGVDLVRALRDEPRTRDIPLVVLSTKEEAQVKAAAFGAGANDYLVKLPDRLELCARLRYHAASYRRLRERDQAYAFIRNAFGRYVSDEIVESLLASPGGLALGGERREVTVLMSDLRGFTQLAETLPPEQVVAVLNNYVSVMAKVIARHGGTIDELIGDAILVIFGAPVWRADDARRALLCAIEMQLAVPLVAERNRQAGLPAIEIGIGLETGLVVAGNIGSERRAKYGIVGMPVNVCARIESFTVAGQVLASASTIAAAGEGIDIVERIEIALKGSLAPLEVASVRGIAGLTLPPLPPPPPLAPALPVRFTVADDDTVHHGVVTRIWQSGAEIVAPPPPRGAWVRLEMLDAAGGARWGGVRGEVVSRDDNGFTLRLSPISKDVVEFVRRL